MRTKCSNRAEVYQRPVPFWHLTPIKGNSLYDLNTLRGLCESAFERLSMGVYEAFLRNSLKLVLISSSINFHLRVKNNTRFRWFPVLHFTT